MPDFAVQTALRLAVILPATVLLAPLAWLTLKKLDIVKSGMLFRPGDMRTWPLSFILVDAAFFAVILSIILAWVDGSASIAGIAAGVSALFTIGVAPRLAARFLK
jgi:hypothetical protein